MEDKSVITMYGLTLIAGLEAFALYQGIDGTMLMIILGGMFMAIGIALPQPEFLKGLTGEGLTGEK